MKTQQELDALLTAMNKDYQEKREKRHDKIKEYYKDMPPYTEEELTKPRQPWLANQLMAIRSKYTSEILKIVKKHGGLK